MIGEAGNKKLSRREFLKSAARFAAAACLSGAGIFTFAAKRISFRGKRTNGTFVPCETCALLEKCVLSGPCAGARPLRLKRGSE